MGDGDAKAEGVMAEPEVEQLCLTAQDTFLILASDGLWDHVRPSEAVGLVHDTVKVPPPFLPAVAAHLVPSPAMPLIKHCRALLHTVIPEGYARVEQL